MQTGPGFICPTCHDDHQPPACTTKGVAMPEFEHWLQRRDNVIKTFQADDIDNDIALEWHPESRKLRVSASTGASNTHVYLHEDQIRELALFLNQVIE